VDYVIHNKRQMNIKIISKCAKKILKSDLLIQCLSFLKDNRAMWEQQTQKKL